MKDTVHIVVTKNGVDRMMKTDNYRLKAGERAFKLEVEIPDAVFKPISIPTVKMTVPAEALSTVIEAEVKPPVRGPL